MITCKVMYETDGSTTEQMVTFHHLPRRGDIVFIPGFSSIAFDVLQVWHTATNNVAYEPDSATVLMLEEKAKKIA